MGAHPQKHHLMKLETLKDLHFKELKDLHSAETQLIKALPKMAKAAFNQNLAEGSINPAAIKQN
jgi:ferritin-like metal-binding protein YciE